MRLYGIGREEVEATADNPLDRAYDSAGNLRLFGETGDGRPILAVLAKDDPDFVITVFDWS